MSLEQAAAALLVKNDQLKREIEHLRSLVSLFQENQMLTSRTHSSSDSTLTDLTGSKHSDRWHSSIDEQQFMRDLHQNRPNMNFRTSSPVNFKSNMNFRTSSPVNFKSFLQSSVLKNAEEAEELHSQADVPPFALGHPRLLGEIAYQLDRRILSYVFQAHQRLYGFILLNIPQRIVEVSTHPLTGHMDEAYRLYLSNRFTDLMESLGKLGYKLALHAPFCEFIVNSYGILKERPRKGSSQWAEYNNPDFLIKMIENIAPRRLQKDMLLVLSCLCYLSTKDKKPLLAW
ncbi:PREDICTED: speriolin [Poecilia mexicana]|uniref:speriolin-like protein n=1 Tax=Poecilia formosa TaxID=48698 RepID=UPI000443D1AE|nr:PREDICTED: speriolin-like protein [Poecilia formosa]XP_014832477.1 PREDICTED: speriolin [Poecilia mexicana]